MQDAVYDRERSSRLRKPLVTKPVDVNGEKQKTDRPHEIRDFGQAAQIVFFLHDRNVSRLLNSFPDFPPPLLPAGEEPVFGRCFPLLFGLIFHEFAYYVGHRNVVGLDVLLELFDRR